MNFTQCINVCSDTLGPVVFAPVKKDISGNVDVSTVVLNHLSLHSHLASVGQNDDRYGEIQPPLQYH